MKTPFALIPRKLRLRMNGIIRSFNEDKSEGIHFSWRYEEISGQNIWIFCDPLSGFEFKTLSGMKIYQEKCFSNSYKSRKMFERLEKIIIELDKLP